MSKKTDPKVPTVYDPYQKSAEYNSPENVRARAIAAAKKALTTAQANYDSALATRKKAHDVYKTALDYAFANPGNGFLAPITRAVRGSGTAVTQLTLTISDKMSPSATPFATGDPVYIWGVGKNYDSTKVGAAYVVGGATGRTTVVVLKPTPGWDSISKNVTGYIGRAGGGGADIRTAFERWLIVVDRDALVAQRLDELNKAKKAVGEVPSAPTTPQKPKDDKKTVNPPSPLAPVKYNVPSLKSAYHRNDEYYVNNMLFGPGGSPATSSSVTNARQLWANATDAHKGMIQTYAFWTSNQSKDPNLPSWYTKYGVGKNRYGFQFLYNPTTVAMSWGGTPAVDPGFIMSGKDTTPYVTPSASSSTISFSVLLNRRPDLGAIETLGADAVASRSVEFYGKQIDLTDIKQIEQRGTMYDVEYLLKTLVGFEQYSALRGYSTSDIGFLLGYTVEVHLGKNLRYLGTIAGFEVTHTHFTKDMVPVMGSINLMINRRIEPSAASAATSIVQPASSGIGNTARAQVSI
jgi:hypothetical protein